MGWDPVGAAFSASQPRRLPTPRVSDRGCHWVRGPPLGVTFQQGMSPPGHAPWEKHPPHPMQPWRGLILPTPWLVGTPLTVLGVQVSLLHVLLSACCWGASSSSSSSRYSSFMLFTCKRQCGWGDEQTHSPRPGIGDTRSALAWDMKAQGTAMWMPGSMVPPPQQPRQEPPSSQYLQKVLALAVHHLALAPALEEPLKLHEEQEEALPELL